MVYHNVAYTPGFGDRKLDGSGVKTIFITMDLYIKLPIIDREFRRVGYDNWDHRLNNAFAFISKHADAR
jgi:hypothetical protein